MKQTFIILCAPILILSTSHAAEIDYSGSISLENRYFPHHNPTIDTNNNLSISAAPKWHYRFTDSRDSLAFAPALRADQSDDNRSHTDIRELYWKKVNPNWELTFGINTLFWGVTETIHLVDIINQTDTLENIDGEDKLGQPMAHFSSITDHGVIDIFALPYFRERHYLEFDSRPQLYPLPISRDSRYESRKGQHHLDYAARWSDTIGIFDIGISYFNGTSRDPEFIPDITTTPELIPYYSQMIQEGLDLQTTIESWLFKLEAIHRKNQRENYNALAVGYEYTFVGIADTPIDIGLVNEYQYSGHKPELFDNDLALGARINFNDVQSTEILAGISTDLNGNGHGFFLESSRRLGDTLKLNLEWRGTSELPKQSPFAALRREQFMQIELQYYY